MKRCKAEFSLKGIPLKPSIGKGLPSKEYQDYQKKCLLCIHAFGWIFLCHMEGYDSINFIDKKSFLNLYCLITWNENHALMVIHYCMESQSYSITQLTETPDNSTQITIPLGTHLHVD